MFVYIALLKYSFILKKVFSTRYADSELLRRRFHFGATWQCITQLEAGVRNYFSKNVSFALEIAVLYVIESFKWQMKSKPIGVHCNF